MVKEERDKKHSYSLNFSVPQIAAQSSPPLMDHECCQ